MNYEQFLQHFAQNDERLVVVTAENRAAIRNLPNVLGKRFVDVGIAEQTMVGVCAGLALRGRIPVAHALAAFLTMRAFEFIRTDVGIGNLPVKLIGGVPGFLSEANGATHQAIEDISLMRGIPNMGIFCPADEQDMLLGLPKILASKQPFYIRYNNLPAIIKHNEEFDIGTSELIQDGDDLTILVHGILLRQAIEAAKILELTGKSVRILNMRTLKPIDIGAIIRASQETSMVVTLEDHFLIGGLFSIVAETLLRNRATCPILPIALREKWFKPALLADILHYEGSTGEEIA